MSHGDARLLLTYEDIPAARRDVRRAGLDVPHAPGTAATRADGAQLASLPARRLESDIIVLIDDIVVVCTAAGPPKPQSLALALGASLTSWSRPRPPRCSRAVEQNSGRRGRACAALSDDLRVAESPAHA